MPGSLVLVATPIGNLEDITLRALRALKEADIIAAEDTRRTAKLLAHYDIATPTISLHEHNERGRLPGLLDRVRQGQTVAVVTDAGMPGVADPGFLAVRQAIDAGLNVQVIPGVSALTTAVAGSGLPTEKVVFLGFAPARGAERRRWLETQRGIGGTLVIFEAPGRVPGLLADAVDVLGDRQAAVARELTKLHETWYRGWLSDLAESAAREAIPAKGEFVVLLSDQERTQSAEASEVSDEEVATSFRELQRTGSMTRRAAVTSVAERYGMSPKSVYSIIERHKRSGE